MVWLLTLAGCILGPKPEACSANSDCRSAFGFGYTCGEEGYCAAPAVSDRCADTFPEDLLTRPEKYKNAVVVGTIYSKEFDTVQRQSTELAIRQYLSDGNNDAYPIAVIHCDTDEDVAYADDLTVEQAAGEVTRMFQQLEVPAIVGPSTSDEAFASFDAINGGAAVVVSPSATSPELSTVEDTPAEGSPGVFWRTVPPDDLQTFAIAEDMKLRSVDSVFIVYEDNSYARPLATGVADLVGAEGIATDLVIYDALENFQLSSVPTDAEVFFVTSSSAEVGDFLDLLGASPAFQGTVFLADAAADPALFSVSPAARSLFPVIRGTRPQVLTEDYGPYLDFAGNYSSLYPEGPPVDSNVYASYSYDAGWMVLFGIEWARANGPITGSTISEGLLHIASGDPVGMNATGLQDARAAFASGADIDAFGASGQLDFVDGEVNNPIEVWVIDEANEAFVVDLVCEPGGSCQSE